MKENSIERDIHLLESYAGMTHKMNDNQGRPKLDQAIEHILSDYKRVLKENEKLRQERELVGLSVRNKRDGTIGIILHQWESGSIAVLENIKPRVINTHDNWNTLEIINDNVEQKRTENNYIPIKKVKDKIEELKKKVEELTDDKGYWGGSDLLEQIKVLEEILEKEQ